MGYQPYTNIVQQNKQQYMKVLLSFFSLNGRYYFKSSPSNLNLYNTTTHHNRKVILDSFHLNGGMLKFRSEAKARTTLYNIIKHNYGKMLFSISTEWLFTCLTLSLLSFVLNLRNSPHVFLAIAIYFVFLGIYIFSMK